MAAIYARALAQLKAMGVDVDSADFGDVSAALKDVRQDVHDVALAALFGARAAHDFGAFWFPQRELKLGAALGFPTTLLVVDPLPIAEQASVSMRTAYAELASSLSRSGGDESRALDARAYADLFDPSFVAFVSVDAKRLASTLEMRAIDVVTRAQNAIANADVDPATKEKAERVLVAPLAKVDANATLATHAGAHGRVVETIVAALATRSSTVAADEGFWADVAFRLVPVPIAVTLMSAFDASSARPLVPGLSVPPRFVAIEAGDIAQRIARLERTPRSDLAAAYARLDDVVRVLGDGGRFAFRRMTSQQLADEAAIAPIVSALRR